MRDGRLFTAAARERVAFAEHRGDAGGQVHLFPAEIAAIARASPARRREFALARLCARHALAALGRTPQQIGRGDAGEPVWPDGLTGSLTHCRGYRAAVVARRSDVLAIGIDAEPLGPVPEGVLDRISLPAERERLAGFEVAEPGVPWARLLFSAKEAVYKAWFPVTHTRLGFTDVRVEPDMVGTFQAQVLQGSSLLTSRLSGRWTVIDGLVRTAVVELA